MLKGLFISLCLMLGVPCFSAEFQHDLKEWQSECLLHLGYGNAGLLLDEPLYALEEFQKATTLLDTSDNSSSIISFLISFGQAIAFDCLGLKEHCRESIGSLFLAINEYDEEEELTDIDEQSIPNFVENKAAIEFLRDLVSVAPSPEIRELLFSFIEDMAEELLPTFEFAEQPFFEKTNWKVDDGKDGVHIQQCKKKSWWKKFRKWCSEAAAWVHDVVKIAKGAKEVKDVYEDWKKKNEQRNYSNNLQMRDL